MCVCYPSNMNGEIIAVMRRTNEDCWSCGLNDLHHPDHNEYDCAYCCAEKPRGEEE